MALTYPIDEAPGAAAADLLAQIAPFVPLEAQPVGAWYVNALAVRAGARSNIMGTETLWPR
ncbi:hypothetical protein [uncultured Ruegeria sp.]|uniref:hypothetical protein n=1 Tax=uncultured Ruegeria sp. TaxID=259304 RepID=UPI002624B11D|nr:hypothetical protein [uncultured Ruegeria sp.]